jgi:hypothetical protein
MTLHPNPLNFPIYDENFIFFFISVDNAHAIVLLVPTYTYAYITFLLGNMCSIVLFFTFHTLSIVLISTNHIYSTVPFSKNHICSIVLFSSPTNWSPRYCSVTTKHMCSILLSHDHMFTIVLFSTSHKSCIVTGSLLHR